jgi:uroporphyrinogen decarboxylase
VDFGGHRSSGIMVQAYKNLRRHLGLPESPLYVYDFIQQLALIEDDVLDLVGSDVVEVGNRAQYDPSHWKAWHLPDGTPCLIPAHIPVQALPGGGSAVYCGDGDLLCVQKPGCLFYEQTCFPYMGREPETFDDLPEMLDKIMWCKISSPPSPLGLTGADLEKRGALAGELRAATDRAVYAIFGGNLVEIGQFAFRIDNFLALMAGEPETAHRFLDALTELHLQNIERFAPVVGPHVDVVGFGDDMGMQTGPQFSPRMYREFFKPRHQLLWRRMKALTPNVKICLHCCGGVRPLLPDMIDAGLDAINPVQFTCSGMDLAGLKRDFGADLTFWGGGCDTRSVLPNATPEEVRVHTLKNLEIMAPGGGFVFQQVHNILADVPPENIVAMFDAVREFNGLPPI